MITFSYEGVEYITDHMLPFLLSVMLPDGRILDLAERFPEVPNAKVLFKPLTIVSVPGSSACLFKSGDGVPCNTIMVGERRVARALTADCSAITTPQGRP